MATISIDAKGCASGRGGPRGSLLISQVESCHTITLLLR